MITLTQSDCLHRFCGFDIRPMIHLFLLCQHVKWCEYTKILSSTRIANPSLYMIKFCALPLIKILHSHTAWQAGMVNKQYHCDCSDFWGNPSTSGLQMLLSRHTPTNKVSQFWTTVNIYKGQAGRKHKETLHIIQAVWSRVLNWFKKIDCNICTSSHFACTFICSGSYDWVGGYFLHLQDSLQEPLMLAMLVLMRPSVA